MPKIQAYKGGGGRITWDQDDFVGGLHPLYSSSLVPLRYFNNTIAFGQSFDPYRNLGSLSPGFNPISVPNATVIQNFLRQGVVNGDYLYVIENGPRIQRVSMNLITFPVTTPAFHTISAHGGHTDVVGNDMTLYTANVSGTPTLCAFYSWNDNTDWDVGRYTFSAFDDDFMTTVPAGTLLSGATTPTLASGQSSTHPLAVGHDDVLYIGDNSYVHAYDGNQGTNGTFAIEALKLPSGFRVTAMCKLQPYYMAVFAFRPSSFNGTGSGSSYQYGESICALWNYVDQDPEVVIDLADNYVSEAIAYKSTVVCFTQGRLPDISADSLMSKVQIYNGSNFDVVTSFHGDVPIRGGAEVAGDIIRWNSRGVMHSWGTPFPGLPSVLNRTNKGLGTSSGFLRSVNPAFAGTFMSSGAGEAGGLESFRIQMREQTMVALTVGAPSFEDGKRGRVSSVTIEFAKTNSSTNTLRLRTYLRDSDGGSMEVFNVTGVTATDLIMKRNFSTGDANNQILPPFNEIYPVFDWTLGDGSPVNAPIIRKLVVEYEDVNLTST